VASVSITLAVMRGIEDFIAITSAFAQSALLSLPVIVLLPIRHQLPGNLCNDSIASKAPSLAQPSTPGYKI
jgi:hypothetical protein